MRGLFTLLGLIIFHIGMSQVPVMRAGVKGEQRELTLSRLDVNVEVVGNISTTTFDMVFQNPINRALEGELTMSLGEGQEVSRYALEIDGNLREGVVVERVKARQTFEAVVRRGIDPGIVSKTKGNMFKTRIYPIPPSGSKRVVLAISERLKGDDKNMHYILPMAGVKHIGEFNLHVKVYGEQGKKKGIDAGYGNIVFDDEQNAYCMEFSRKNYSGDTPIRFNIPRKRKDGYEVFTTDFEGKTYFYVNMRRPHLYQRAKEHPRRVNIYWDNSFSSRNRDMGKEMDFLKRYVQGWKRPVELAIIPFNYVSGSPKVFRVKDDITGLKRYLQQLENDGATYLEALHFNGNCDEIILFSDGISTLGSDNVKLPRVPVSVITSSLGSNYSLLKRMAASTGGEFIDLSVMEIPQASDIMHKDREKYMGCEFDDDALEQVYVDKGIGNINQMSIVGILKKESASLKMNFGVMGKVSQSIDIDIKSGSEAPVQRIWASGKIAHLMMNKKKNRQEIVDLGKQFNIVTDGTAFIVLDRVEDYVEHEIIPPKELQQEYYRLLERKGKSMELLPEIIQKRNGERMDRLSQWYDNPFQKSYQGKRGALNMVDEEVEDELEVEIVESDEDEMIPVTRQQMRNVSARVADDQAQAFTPNRRGLRGDKRGSAAIKILAWLPDAPYMRQLRGAETNEIERLYVQLKMENIDRPAFYIQVSDFLFEKGMRDMAIRVLSNTLEMDLENPELLKGVARRFMDEGETEMAVVIFQEIRDLRPEEPQSYRDLAQAYEKASRYKDALEIYSYILSKDWARFEDVKDVILNEMNHLIDKHKSALDLNSIDTKFIKAMPLDIRVVIDWSSNDNDIDLWVVDPQGEKCYYKNRFTRLGGKISRDFTRGYGPEEYSLKIAKRGIYTVYINYFSESRQRITGPVTVYATLYTYWGTDREKSQRITIQLKEGKETRQIGEVEIN